MVTAAAAGGASDDVVGSLDAAMGFSSEELYPLRGITSLRGVRLRLSRRRKRRKRIKAARRAPAMALPMPMPAAAPGLMKSDPARGPSADNALDGREDACGGATLLIVERRLLWEAVEDGEVVNTDVA